MTIDGEEKGGDILQCKTMTNPNILVYGTRLCYQSWVNADDFGANDKQLLTMLKRQQHYSPFNLLWFQFASVKPDNWLEWIAVNPEFQQFCFYSPNKKELLVNKRTILEGLDKKPVDSFTQVLANEVTSYIDIHTKSLMPLDEPEYVRIFGTFPPSDPKIVFVEVCGLSRALLQQWIRHFQFPLVKSTRYTLREIMKTNEPNLVEVDKVIDGVNSDTIAQLRAAMIKHNSPNDYAKYALPEGYRTHLVSVFPIWSFKNLMKVRNSKTAMWEWEKWIKLLNEECENYGALKQQII